MTCNPHPNLLGLISQKNCPNSYDVSFSAASYQNQIRNKLLNIINKGGVSFERESFKLCFLEISCAASKGVMTTLIRTLSQALMKIGVLSEYPSAWTLASYVPP